VQILARALTKLLKIDDYKGIADKKGVRKVIDKEATKRCIDYYYNEYK
jgi:hypothetical protein